MIAYATHSAFCRPVEPSYLSDEASEADEAQADNHHNPPPPPEISVSEILASPSLEMKTFSFTATNVSPVDRPPSVVIDQNDDTPSTLLPLPAQLAERETITTSRSFLPFVVARRRRRKDAATAAQRVLYIPRWLVETQRVHFARLWLVFTYLRGPAGEEIDLRLADMEHAPHAAARAVSAVARGLPALAALPKAWADPACQTVKVRAGPVVMQPRYFILEILAERMAGDGAEYLVAWLGYAEATLEPRGLLLEDAPALVKE
ncbi:hypothetical protein B0H13DRAFT_2371952 [Mycena leptocephala]|nr:hypothetical protein B0H13DRAFT_2371952 [Mycena leptocephala]